MKGIGTVLGQPPSLGALTGALLGPSPSLPEVKHRLLWTDATPTRARAQLSEGPVSWKCQSTTLCHGPGRMSGLPEAPELQGAPGRAA